ncbi:hypothetical protein MG293_007560 [Ovis ammon polii]|uniref:Uncharacterized protein n=1 Tax=Ovis ammon polii TaxID=230172 RepID=A0AAD4UA15_OVIAM|nr:hypothetical protein MG293_007560 [Ovis ammon polii]KAI4573500.1 hypothetical protein MJT46_004740 [Ovis ammon polii x Ovis aries]
MKAGTFEDIQETVFRRREFHNERGWECEPDPIFLSTGRRAKDEMRLLCKEDPKPSPIELSVPLPPPDSRSLIDRRLCYLSPSPNQQSSQNPRPDREWLLCLSQRLEGIPVANNKDASRSPPPARPRLVTPALRLPAQRPLLQAGRSARAPTSPPRPHAPAPEGRSQGVRLKGPGENLCRRAVLYEARSTLPPLPLPDSARLRAGPAEKPGTRAAAPGAGTWKDGGARGGRLKLLSLASRRPCSSTRARVLLTNGPGARRWNGRLRRRGRLLLGLTSRAAVVAAAAAAATSLSGTADTTQTQPDLSLILFSSLPYSLMAAGLALVAGDWKGKPGVCESSRS